MRSDGDRERLGIAVSAGLAVAALVYIFSRVV